MIRNALIKLLSLVRIPVVAVDKRRVEFIDSVPSYLSYRASVVLALCQALIGDLLVVPPPIDTDVIAGGSATLTLPSTLNDDLIGLVYSYTANFNVSPDVQDISIAYFDRNGTAISQSFSIRPIAQSSRIFILFASSSQDVVAPMKVRVGYIATTDVAPVFQAVGITFTITTPSNGMTVSIVGMNQKHEAVMTLLNRASRRTQPAKR